jgi:hypothetical protein
MPGTDHGVGGGISLTITIWEADPAFSVAPDRLGATISGTSDAGVRLDIFLDDVLVVTIPAQDNPSGTFSTTISITPGTHAIRVQDDQGQSATKTVTIP